MNTDYLKYLALLLLIVIVSVLIAAAFILKLKVKGQKKSGKSDEVAKRGHHHEEYPDRACKINKPVLTGNISIFFDRLGSVTIIPYVPDLFGSGKATVDITFLLQPYRPKKLGGAIRDSLASCRNGKPAGSIQLMEKLHTRDWKSFTEGKLSLSVFCKKGAGIVFNTTVRTAEGAYVYMKKGAEFCLPADADDESIGLKALELIKRCR